MTFTKTKQIYYENGHQYPKLLKAKPKVMPKPSKKQDLGFIYQIK